MPYLELRCHQYIFPRSEVDCSLLVQMAKAFRGKDALFYIMADRGST